MAASEGNHAIFTNGAGCVESLRVVALVVQVLKFVPHKCLDVKSVDVSEIWSGCFSSTYNHVLAYDAAGVVSAGSRNVASDLLQFNVDGVAYVVKL